MERYDVDDVRAFEMLRKLSQDSNTRLSDIASASSTRGERQADAARGAIDRSLLSVDLRCLHASRGTISTGTGVWRMILAAREPRNTRATGLDSLDPMSSRSPSCQLMSLSAVSQSCPRPIDTPAPGSFESPRTRRAEDSMVLVHSATTSAVFGPEHRRHRRRRLDGERRQPIWRVELAAPARQPSVAANRTVRCPCRPPSHSRPVGIARPESRGAPTQPGYANCAAAGLRRCSARCGRTARRPRSRRRRGSP